MNNRKLVAQRPATGSPQDPAHPLVLGQNYMDREPVSAASRRVLPPAHRQDSRPAPYARPLPVRDSRNVERDTAANARLSVSSSNALLAPEGHQMALGRPQDPDLPSVPRERPVTHQLLPLDYGREHNTAPRFVAAQHMWDPRHRQIDVGQNQAAPRIPLTGRLAGRVSMALHNAGHVQAPRDQPARRLLPDARRNRPHRPRRHPPIQVPVLTLEERIARQNKIYGVVCVLEQEQIKLFDFKERRMRVIPNNFDISPRLYQYIWANEDGNEFDISDYKIKFSGIRHISTSDNQVLTWATSPNAEEMAQMSETSRAKFEGKLWSPYLGFLTDPRHLFNRNVAGREVWIAAAYAPAENCHFQLDRIDEERYQEDRYDYTPWMKEINGEMDPDEFGYDFAIPTCNFRRLKGYVVEHAVCIATDVRNPVHNEERLAKGSKPTCHVFFNRMHGIYRCLKPATLGGWYSHTFNDARKYEEYRHLSTYKAATVSTMQPVAAPLLTQVNNNRVEMEVEFDSKYLDRFDFFWDKFAGKVEVGPLISRFIKDWIQFPLTKAKNKSPKEYAICEERVKKGVTIRARVGTYAWHRTAESYPTQGAFSLLKVLLMKFEDNNEIIFQDLE
ncbi:hypothetical protein CAEBREN_22730 [Caenorhabditis brenneri]|uniref:DUF7038 domain-containing protein n=1 Tax=Caenorhabditis brenneri TaxID=135651 RepID=G0NDW6_CAEBE|nr:hypothetical protein CAEBREN_22730 [Caenorhabditis brenneri]